MPVSKINCMHDLLRECDHFMCMYPQYSILAALFNILWATLMGTHWLVTGALLADLYRKYCNDQHTLECDGDDRKFTVLIVMSFVGAGGWVSVTKSNYFRVVGLKTFQTYTQHL